MYEALRNAITDLDDTTQYRAMREDFLSLFTVEGFMTEESAAQEYVRRLGGLKNVPAYAKTLTAGAR